MSTRRKVLNVVILGVLLGACTATPALGGPLPKGSLIADSCVGSGTGTVLLSTTMPQLGQSFTAQQGGMIDQVSFQIARQTSTSTGAITVDIYAMSGTYGSTSIPAGQLIARSHSWNAAQVTAVAPEAPSQATFVFIAPVPLIPGNRYVAVLHFWGSSGGLVAAFDASGTAHSGNASFGFPATWEPKASYDAYFRVLVRPSAPVYRFYNLTNGTHFYTDSESEKDYVVATWPKIYSLEGVAYSVNPLNNAQPLYRLYNKKSGSHFYTASADERDSALAKWPTVFSYDGPTYAVNTTQVERTRTVWRFYNLKNGSHFYTSSAEERDYVQATWPSVYKLEGPAFYIGQ